MPRIATPLTSTQVRHAKPRDNEYNLSDGLGLMLRVKPNSKKLWLFNYQKPNTKKRTNITFGRFPEVSLAEAREARNDARKLLAYGIDPKHHRDQERSQSENKATQTFKAIAADWMEIKKSQVSEDHAKDIWRSLELHIFQDLGNIPIHDIAAPTVIEVFEPLKAKGSYETIKRVCQRFNEVMVFAVNTGVIFSNPTEGIRSAFPSPNKANYPTLKPTEITEFLRDLDSAGAEMVTKALIEVQMHTMLRPVEAAGARWEEIDFEEKIWTVPAERMKKKREHKVPLSSHVMSVFERLRPITGHRNHVFCSKYNPIKHISEQSPNMVIKRMHNGKYKGRIVAHGLRSLASTVLNEETNFHADVIESALAHKDTNEVRAAYNRAEYLVLRRELMDWWSQYLEEAKN